MVSWLVDYARGRGVPRIDLLATFGNEAAIRLYEKFGFTGRKRLQMMLLVEEDERLEKILHRKIREERTLDYPDPDGAAEGERL